MTSSSPLKRALRLTSIPWSKEERALYDEIKKNAMNAERKGLPQFIYELPVDAYDDVYEDVDIYSENFDEEVMKEVNKGE